MQKVITFFLCLALVCAVIPGSAFDESIFYGAWVVANERDSGGLLADFFYLAPDHTVYYMNRVFSADSEEYGRAAVKSWSTTEDGIHIVFGDNSETDAYMSKDGFLLIPSGEKYIPFGKVPVYGEEKGSRFSPGTYYAGQDFPAGRYTLEVPSDKQIATIEIKNSEESYSGKTYWLGEIYGSFTAVLTLKDGNVIESTASPFFLYPYNGTAE